MAKSQKPNPANWLQAVVLIVETVCRTVTRVSVAYFICAAAPAVVPAATAASLMKWLH